MWMNITNTVKKLMGWCPYTTPVMRKPLQYIDCVNPFQIPIDRSNVENVQSKNIMFSANNSLSTLCILTCFNSILQLSIHLDYAILIPITVATCSFFYLIVVKTSQAGVSIDENGVLLKSFMFKNITLDYNEIESVTPKKPMKSIKCSNKVSVLLAILLIFIVALFTYPMISDGYWQWTIPVALLLPVSLFFMYKQDRRYHEMDAQLSIQSENKNRYTRWYELISRYSIITDETTASRIQAVIEHYMEAQ